MKLFITIVGVCALAGIALGLDRPDRASVEGSEAASIASKRAPAVDDLIVHEWGTFTGFVGSDGVHLPFGVDAGAGVPSFVVTRREQAERQNVKTMWDFGKGEGIHVLQRMETPVIYFYTQRQRQVTARVDFPGGQLSEFYPPVRNMSPAFGDGPGEYYHVERPRSADGAAAKARSASKFENGSLDWGTLTLIPQICCEPNNIPEVPAAEESALHYRLARATDAATVRFSDRPGEMHEERFLFYRGLGDFALPVTLRSSDEDHFEIDNAGPSSIRFAMLLRVDGTRARVATYENITAQQKLTLPADSMSIDAAGDLIARALIAEGLYEKEARAMVKTWSSSWLGESGTRLLYTVPRTTTEELLPLHLSPAPDQLVRVLVGRIDIVTPADETKLQSLLAQAPQIKALSPDDARFLKRFGRFLDPALDRAVALRTAGQRRKETQALRSQYWNATAAQKLTTDVESTSAAAP